MAYRAIVGFNYPDDKGGEVRVEEGSILESLPEPHAASILEQGCTEEILDAETVQTPASQSRKKPEGK